MINSLDPRLAAFFQPSGVVIIGASASPTKLGFALARNLVRSGYTGAIHFVHPGGGEILGRPSYTAVAEVPDPVDLALILVPAGRVAAAIAEAGQRGIRSAIVLSGGFRETGPDGAALEQELLRVARTHDMRLVGPNCVGMIDTHVPLDTTFLPPPAPLPGDIAFISHSGAICEVVIDWANGQGFGLSRLVSLGNQVDLNESELLAAVAEDSHTRVITLYLEGVADGRRFVETAAQVTRRKPVIALKAGRSEAGQRAVASHTGALAGQDAAFDAAFRQAGVIRAATTEEMFDWARALALAPLPAGPAVAVLTNAGGPGVTATDALESNGLRLAALAPATTDALRAMLPPSAGVNNPVDMLASATAEEYTAALRLLLADPGVDSVLLILPPPPVESAGAVARATIPVIDGATKPVLAVLMGSRMIVEAVEHYRAARVPEYHFPERAAAALGVLTKRAAWLRGLQDEAPTVAEPAAEQRRTLARAIIDPLAATHAGQFLPPEALEALLAAYDIPLPPARPATTAEEAAALAEAMGFPVALKVISADIPHKSDVGGVALGLSDAAAVADGFRRITGNAAAARPDARIEGVIVQRMIDGGQEVIVGVSRDPHFGPLVMFGSGGVEVEGLSDVAFELAPPDAAAAARLLESTWAGRKLAGFRHLPPADREATLGVIMRLGRLAADCPQIAEIEINPLRVLPAGRGVWAVDVRARLAAAK